MSFEKLSKLNPQICEVAIIRDKRVFYVGFMPNDCGNITLPPGYISIQPFLWEDWLVIYGTKGTIKFTEEESQTEFGVLYVQTLELFYPGEDETTALSLDGLSESRWYVRLTFNSGIVKAMAGVDNPCICKSIFSTERGGRLITFTHKSPVQAYLLA